MDGDIIKYLEKKKIKRICLLYGITFISSIYLYNLITKDNNHYETIKNDAFDSYRNGLVYIGDEQFLDNLKDIKTGDILVEDHRNLSNPNMKIRNSYLVTDSNDRKEILEILCEYEKQYPSDWNRTIEAMDLEWKTHNFLYYFNYKKDHTTDVDLDNNDEANYSKVLKKHD